MKRLFRRKAVKFKFPDETKRSPGRVDGSWQAGTLPHNPRLHKSNITTI